jgi:DNA-binding PadR family transcriptional regulator
LGLAGSWVSNKSKDIALDPRNPLQDHSAWSFTEYHTAYDAESGEVMSVRHALLALLSEGPKYGLQLREEFEARTGEVWPLNVGQVYTTLQRLERDGFVESDDTEATGPQRGFQITASGQAELAAWLRTPPDLASPPRDELVMKVLVAVRMPGTDVHEVIQVHRKYLVELMQQWTRIKEDEGESDLGLALVVDAELFRLDAVIRWLDSADGRLRRAAADLPGPVPASLPRLRRRVGVRR